MTFGKRWLLCVLSLVLVACSSTTAPTPPQTVAPEAAQTQPAAPASSEQSQLATDVPVQPQVTDTTGSIVGSLVDEEGKPIVGLGVFVADITPHDPPAVPIISFSLNNSRRGVTNEQGRFVINEVAANSYSLAVFLPNASNLIPDETGAPGSAIKVDVTAGKITDVGTLKIKRPG